MVINLQGDLPALDPEQIRTVAAALEKSGADIATLAAPIDNPADEVNPAVVKAVVAWDADGRMGRALYFTRATAPTGEGTLWHHVGLYAYRREALESFVALPPSPLEAREKLEQLRALEAGMTIAVARVDEAAAVGRYARRSRTRQKAVCRMIMPPSPKRQDASPSRASRAPMPTWRRARRCRMPQAVPAPTFEDAIAAARDGDTDLVHHPGGEFADRPHRRHPSSAARFRPAYRGRAFPAHPSPVAGPEGRDAGRRQERLQPGAGAGAVPHASCASAS